MPISQVVSFLTAPKNVKFIDQVRPTFKNLPHLPQGVIEFLVKIAPWLAGLGGIVGVFSGLGMMSNSLGFGMSWLSQLAGISPVYYLLSGLLQLVGGGILLLAFNPLKNRTHAGWLLMYWSVIVSTVQSLLPIVFISGAFVSSLIGVAIGLAISLYFLFELEAAYKN